jgi:integrase
MGSTGWRLRPPRGRSKTWTVACEIEGREYERSTGERAETAARAVAPRVYALILSEHEAKPRPVKVSGALLDLVDAWLTTQEGSKDPDSIATCEVHLRHVAGLLVRLDRITTQGCTEYVQERLRKVKATTVRKEASTLRQFVEWLGKTGRIGWRVEVPGVPRKATGTKFEKNRRTAAIELSTEEVEAILERLPQKSERKGFWVRPFYVVQYETALRPELVEALSVPENWAPGMREMRIEEEQDKERWVRTVPLSELAIAALELAAPKVGLIFGAFDRNRYVKAVARKVLRDDPVRARAFTGAHLRSARITHLLDAGATFTGTQYLTGHKTLTSLSRYGRPGRRAAEAALALAVAAPAPGREPHREPGTTGNQSGNQCEGEDSNLHESYPTSTSTQTDSDKSRT